MHFAAMSISVRLYAKNDTNRHITTGPLLHAFIIILFLINDFPLNACSKIKARESAKCNFALYPENLEHKFRKNEKARGVSTNSA